MFVGVGSGHAAALSSFVSVAALRQSQISAGSRCAPHSGQVLYNSCHLLPVVSLRFRHRLWRRGCRESSVISSPSIAGSTLQPCLCSLLSIHAGTPYVPALPLRSIPCNHRAFLHFLCIAILFRLPVLIITNTQQKSIVKRMRKRTDPEKEDRPRVTGSAEICPGRPPDLHRKKSRPQTIWSLPCIIFALRGFWGLTTTAFCICGGSLVYSFSAPCYSKQAVGLGRFVLIEGNRGAIRQYAEGGSVFVGFWGECTGCTIELK